MVQQNLTAFTATNGGGSKSAPPSAAERDAAKRAGQQADSTVSTNKFNFLTRNLSSHEKAAVVAVLTVLTAARAEEAGRIKKVARIELQPWRRSQRALRQITEFLDGA